MSGRREFEGPLGFNIMGVLDLAYYEAGWREKVVVDEEGEYAKKIVIPSGLKTKIKPVEISKLSTSLKVSRITQNEIDLGNFMVPMDALNLANIKQLKHTAPDQFRGLNHNLIAVVVNYFNLITSAYAKPVAERQVIFSESFRSMIFLPGTYDNTSNRSG